VIPDVEIPFGKQPAVPELKMRLQKNRFNLVFIQFFAGILFRRASVIFINDLHTDSASN
jgi:predicted ATPase